MARAGVYGFRDKTLDIEEALELEAQKEPGNQGTRTFARDLRRFFVLTGCIGTAQSSQLHVTKFGKELLNTGSGSPEQRFMWRSAMQSIALTDEQGRVAHPYAILL